MSVPYGVENMEPFIYEMSPPLPADHINMYKSGTSTYKQLYQQMIKKDVVEMFISEVMDCYSE